MTMATLVMKFGGSLMADARRISQVAQVIHAESLAWNHMVVVVSAMAGATDALLQATTLAITGNAIGYRRRIAALRNNHIAVIRALFEGRALQDSLIAQLDRILFNALTVCDRVATNREALGRDRDVILAVGEKMIVPILTALVRQEGLRTAFIDAESLIVTDDTYQNAHPLPDLIDERVDRIVRPMLNVGIVPIIGGFIGATVKGTLTTLGRGGSDYTATLLAVSLRAEEVWIWTNVDGVMSSDPALVPGARVIPVLSYEEVNELSYFGARVLHPRAVEPLVPHGIPLRVRNPFNLDHAGTLIQAEAAEPGTVVKAVTAVDGLCLYTSGQPIDLTEFLSQIRQIVGQAAAGPVLLMQSHLRSVLVFVVPTSEGPNGAVNAARRLTAGFGAGLSHWNVIPVKVIAMMGTPAALDSGLSSIQPVASVVGPGNRRLLAVLPGDAQAAMRQLHKLTEPTSSQFWPQAPLPAVERSSDTRNA